MLLGYARVSTADQKPDHQVDALRRAGVAEKDIYVDHASGAKASRPKLDELLRLLRGGDTLKITRLDRLGRSVLHLVTLGAELRDRGVGLHVLEQGIDTSTAEGREREAANCVCNGPRIAEPCSPRFAEEVGGLLEMRGVAEKQVCGVSASVHDALLNSPGGGGVAGLELDDAQGPLQPHRSARVGTCRPPWLTIRVGRRLRRVPAA